MNKLVVQRTALGFRFMEIDPQRTRLFGSMRWKTTNSTPSICLMKPNPEFVTFLVLTYEPTDDDYEEDILDICMKRIS